MDVFEKARRKMIEEMAKELKNAGIKRLEAVVVVDEMPVIKIISSDPPLPKKLDELAIEFIDLVSDTLMVEAWDTEVEEREDGYYWEKNIHGVNVKIVVW